MFVQLLWFCITPDEPHGKKGGHFRASFCDLPIGAEQKWVPENCHLFFKSSTFF